MERLRNKPGIDPLSELLVPVRVRSSLYCRSEFSAPWGFAVEARLIREQPSRHWTIRKLGSAVAMSRSAFAARFQQLIGRPPMRFVADYRLSKAAQYLRGTAATLLEIAHHAGVRVGGLL